MPHVKSPCENMENFVALHRNQLEMSGIPECFWNTLFLKFKLESMDAGDAFIMQQVVEEEFYEDDELEMDENVSEDGLQTILPSCISWKVVVSIPEGIKANDPQHIYLIDHAWTYRPEQARNQLLTMPGLLERMADLMGIITEEREKSEVVEDIFKEMWKFNQTYNIGNENLGSESAVPIWYIMDEFGSRIQHSDAPTVRTVPFCYVPTKTTFTIMWPLCDLQPGDELTRDYLDCRANDPLTRRLLLLPWQPDDMRHLSFDQKEDDQMFARKFSVHETLPNLELPPPELPRNRNVKVFSDVDQVIENLTDPRFEFVKSIEEADIIWTKHYLKDFKSFSEESSMKFINQFPFEMVLTIKNMLAVVCRRMAGNNAIDHATLETFPSWLPTTFNLQTEIPHFVSYFQHREASGLDNYWICKPFNLARGLDTHITNDLNYLLRLAETGPKIVCKYVEDPVLLEREDVGLVKFDLRFVVMLVSIAPLQLVVHQKFIVRVANKSFSLDNFDDYEKHFTVMNYRKDAKLKQISCEDFVDLFNIQYPDEGWSSVQDKIFGMIREMFTAAVIQPPPKGFGQSPQSRAIYGVDVMLKWKPVDSAKKTIEPVLLECNFGPDNTRLVRSYPDFFNDIFSVLFCGDGEGRNVMPL